MVLRGFVGDRIFRGKSVIIDKKNGKCSGRLRWMQWMRRQLFIRAYDINKPDKENKRSQYE